MVKWRSPTDRNMGLGVVTALPLTVHLQLLLIWLNSLYCYCFGNLVDPNIKVTVHFLIPSSVHSCLSVCVYYIVLLGPVYTQQGNKINTAGSLDIR